MNISPQDCPYDHVILAKCNIDSNDGPAFTEKIEDPLQYPAIKSIVALLSPSKFFFLNCDTVKLKLKACLPLR